MLQTPIEPATKKQLWLGRQAVERYLWEQYFLVQFPTNVHCWKELFRDADKILLKCRNCGASPSEINFEARVRICEFCGEKTWFSAGTYFDHAREPKAWLGAIWFMERGIAPSSSHFAKLARIAQSSALNILRKMRMVMLAEMKDDFPTVESAVLYEVVSKRSRETPARSHPHAEEVEIARRMQEEKEEMENYNRKKRDRSTRTRATNSSDKEQAASEKHRGTADRENDLDCNGEQDVGLGRENDHGVDEQRQPSKQEPRSQLDSVLSVFDEVTQSVYQVLSDVPTSFDRLCQLLSAQAGQLSAALIMLSISGLVAQLPGDLYVRVQSEDTNFSRSEGASETPADLDTLIHYNTGAYSSSSDDSTSAKEVPGSCDSVPAVIPETIPETKPVSLTEFVDFAILHFMGISRKHIQLYVSALWCRRVRYRWGFGGLRELCLRSAAITDEDVLNYVTPPIVTLFEHEN
jgi:DprA winged helix domain